MADWRPFLKTSQHGSGAWFGHRTSPLIWAGLAPGAQFPTIALSMLVALVVGVSPEAWARELAPLRTAYEGRARIFGEKSPLQPIAELNFQTDYIRWDDQELALIFGKKGSGATEAIHTVLGQLPRYYVRPVENGYIAHFGNHTGVFRATHFTGDPTRYLRETMDLLDGRLVEAGYTVTTPLPQPEGGWVREIHREGSHERHEHVFFDRDGRVREIFQTFRVGGGTSAYRGVSARLTLTFAASKTAPETAVWEYFLMTRENRVIDRPRPGTRVSSRHEYRLLEYRQPNPGEGPEMLKQLSQMEEVAYKTIHGKTAQIGDKQGKMGMDPRMFAGAEAVTQNNQRARAHAIRGARVTRGWWPWVLGGFGGTLVMAALFLNLRKK